MECPQFYTSFHKWKCLQHSVLHASPKMRLLMFYLQHPQYPFLVPLRRRQMTVMTSENYRSIEFVQQFALADNNEISKVRVTVHLWGESTGDRWFPVQRVSNTENMSIRWRHNVKVTSIHRETVFSVVPIPTENKRSCFHPRIAVSIVPVVILIIKSIPLLNYRVYMSCSAVQMYARWLWPLHTWLFWGSFCALIFRPAYIVKMPWNILYQIIFHIKTAKCWAQNALRTYRRDYSSERLRGTRSVRYYHGEVSHRFWCATIWQFFVMDSLSVDRFSFAFWEV